ncbi:acyl n-acyltransferase [Fusarium subglutinans]|uniref:Acyl n-acyltransferase n=1 Tax=Gibberella subglutinans TaxID=42677 RepID=A0A8H5PIW1_GIBSU|nr:acyl n-acyltransferase [Fusarium subglutinans]KAF5597731.1 acyl n-acyltransferase [Fusarium subglutinans]
MFQIRDAGSASEDADFITAAFDSSLPFLSETGNTGQWGTIPFSQRDGFLEGTRDDITQSEIFRLSSQGQRRRVFIAEIEETPSSENVVDLYRRKDDQTGQTFVSVGAAMILDDEFASHIRSVPVLEPYIPTAEKRGGFVFLDFLIADHRVPSAQRKGAGLALLEHVKAYACQHEKLAIFLDCWTGGTDKLVAYYESAGFSPVADFEYHKRNGDVWPGRLFRLDLAPTLA